MLSFFPESAHNRTPVSVVCGVDSGAKTNLIDQMLDHGSSRWVVISNESEGPEFTTVLTERIAGQMVPHAIGCLCCVTRSGLVSNLRRLYARRAQGELDFDQVLIETLGDADPAPVMQTLLNNALVTDYYRLDSVVAVVTGTDCLNALVGSRYGFKQIAVADRIVLDAPALAAPDIHTRLQRLNPAASQVLSDQPFLAQVLTGAGLETRLLAGDLDGWLGAPHYTDRDQLDNGLHGFAIESAQPIDWEAFHGWLNAGTQTNGDIMYRTKGVVQIKGLDEPVIINGVQHVYQPPQRLPGAHVHCSQFLFITANLDRAAVEASLRDDLPHFQYLSEARAARRARAANDPSIPI